MNQNELQNTVLCGDALEVLKTLPDECVQMCVTSPPYYGLRDYGAEGQIGCEQTPFEYIDRLTEIFREVRRVLKSNGTLWLNIADSYAGSGKGVWSPLPSAPRFPSCHAPHGRAETAPAHLRPLLRPVPYQTPAVC